MPNYLNGKIYTIRSYKTDEIYVGSTTQTLSKRMSKHRGNFKCYKNGTYNYVSSFEILKYDDAYIELVILNPCNSKTELDAVEGQYVRKMDCVNKIIPGRSRKEYYVDNREKIKQYYTDNKDQINEYKSQKHTCICGGKFTTSHKAQHLNTKKHQLYITMEQQKQKLKPKSKLSKITDYYKPSSVNSSSILVL